MFVDQNKCWSQGELIWDRENLLLGGTSMLDCWTCHGLVIIRKRKMILCSFDDLTNHGN